MKRCILFLLTALVVSAPVHGKGVYRFESSYVPNNQFTEGCSVAINSENPDCIFLMLADGNHRLRLKGMTSSRLLGPDTWSETYGTERKRHVRIPYYYGGTTVQFDSSYSVVLYKDLEKGIYAVELLTKSNRIRFVPQTEEVVPVTILPPVFIEEIQFANVNGKGKVINGYGSKIAGREVVKLAQKMVYRSLLEDIPLTLDIRMLTPEGRLMRDGNSPKDCSRRITFRTGATGEVLEQSLGELKAKFGKGHRMEVYCDGRKLLSVPVPTRGEIVPIPIYNRITPSYVPKNTKDESLPTDLRAMFENLYQRNYTGPIFDGEFILTGWKTVEL